MEVNRKVVHHSNTSTPVATPLPITPAATPDLDQVPRLGVPFARLSALHKVFSEVTHLTITDFGFMLTKEDPPQWQWIETNQIFNSLTNQNACETFASISSNKMAI